MSTMLTYTLPTLQLVCHLVYANNSNGGTIQPSPPTTTTPRPPLPSGYVAYPNFGAAYKVYKDFETWDEARELCSREGAYLAEIDSMEKIRAVKDQADPWDLSLHVGLHLNNGNETWYSVYTGLPVRNIPWGSGEPSGDGFCSMILDEEVGLGRYICDAMAGYVCQIPYN